MTRRFSFTGSLFVIGFLLHCMPIWSFDLWWQLTEARWILQNKAFPTDTIFSYTHFPYIAHEWASSMVFYLIHGAFGGRGLMLFAPIVFGLFGVLFYHLLRKTGADPWPAWLYTLLFMFIAHWRFPLRPELFTNFFLLALLYLDKTPFDRHSGANRNPDINNDWTPASAGVTLVLYFALFALWSNFHGQFAFGIVYLLISFATTLSAESGARLLVSCLGLFCNPYGWKILQIPFMYFAQQKSLFAVSTEGQNSPIFSGIAWIVLLPTLGVLLWNWARHGQAPRPSSRKSRDDGSAVSGGRFPWRDAALTAAFGWQALRVNRLFVAFCIIAMPILYRQAAQLLKTKFSTVTKAPPARAAYLGWALVLAIALLRASSVKTAWGMPIDPRSLPEHATEFLERIGATGRLYNSFNFGGYLEWKLYPKVQIFYDERYPYAGLEFEESEARKSPQAWAAFMQRYDADYACLDWVWEGGLHLLLWPAWGKAWKEQSIRSPYESLFPRKDWALIYWDDKALIFARNEPKNRDLIRQYELRWTEPLSWQATLDNARAGRISKTAVLRELEKVESRSGKNWVLERMRAQL